MSDLDVPISTIGKQRREQILALARRQARYRRQRRVAMPSGICLLLTVMAALVLHQPSAPRAMIYDPATQPNKTAAKPQAGHMIATYIQTDPEISDRLAVRTRPTWHYIGDDELIQTLATAGQPAGLIRMNGHTILLTR